MTLAASEKRHVVAETIPQALSRLQVDDIVIGKDVLELISSAMYIDPMTIYREYLQNAADSIDDAKRVGVISEGIRGRVDVYIDSANRSVRIRDNGTGVGTQEFARRLTSIGASGKRGTGARGFRGVGRLAGLGYAQDLIFRSKTSGDESVSELRWDCRKLRSSLRATDGNQEIGELVQNVVTLQQTSTAGYPDRFFEVELKGIVRFKNDRLMSASSIAEYLSQVAPVPFSPEFMFGPQITKALSSSVLLGEVDLHIQGLDGPVYRPHRDTFVDHSKRMIVFDSIEFVEIPSIDGEPAAIAWILHHEYEGAISSAALVKGLRLRSGNVQVGDHTLLEELYPEPRFNSWSVGEVHILDKRVVPNGRRDHFEQNAHYHNLTNHISPSVRDIARRCRTNSIRRKWLREFEIQRTNVSDSLAIISQGSLRPSKRQQLALSVEQQLLKLEMIAGKELLSGDNPEELKRTTRSLRNKLGRALKEKTSDISPLDRLSPHKRKIYEHIFELIYECSSNRAVAKALIDRVILKITI